MTKKRYAKIDVSPSFRKEIKLQAVLQETNIYNVSEQLAKEMKKKRKLNNEKENFDFKL